MKIKITFFRMKNIYLYICISISTLTINAQTFQWVKNYGSNINTEGKSIVVDNSGFIYTAINKTSSSGASGFESFIINKQNSFGIEIWSGIFSSSGFALNSTNCQSIAVDLNGNLYITGYHSGIVNFNGTTILRPTNNNFQAFVIKLNSSGGLVWSKSLGGGYDTKGISIALDRNSNVYTTGYHTGFAFGGSAIGRDIFIAKHDSNGNQKWIKKIGGAGIDNPTSITIDLNNNVLTTGYYSDLVDFDPGINVFNLTSIGKDIFISKLDSSGNFIWAKSFQGDGDKRGSSIKIDIQNNIIIGGAFNGTIDLDPGLNTSIVTSIGQYDVYICKLDPTGNFVWAKNWGSSLDDVCNEISLDSFGNIFTTGSFQSTTDFDPSAGISNITATSTIANGNTDMYISKLYSNGNFAWVKRIGGSGLTVGNAITIENNNLYTTGLFKETTDFNPDLPVNIQTSTNTINSDAFILKLSNTFNCTQPNLNLNGPGCIGAPINLTSDTGIAQIQWYLNGNLISIQQGWNTNGITVAGDVIAGTTSNRLSNPNAVFVDSSGNFYVADMENHRIQKFTPGSLNGITVAGGNGAGSSSIQLNKPTAVYLDKQGYLYVTDYNNQRVQKFPPNSTSTTFGVTVAGGNGPGSTSTRLNNPTGLCIDTLNYLYVSDAANNRIQRFPPNSTNITPGVTVAGGNGAGNASNQISNPFHVFVDDSLSVYIADWGNGRIQKWKNGASSGTTVATNLNYPSAVFVDKNYNLYASDQNNNRILKYLPNSTSGAVIAGGNGQGTASNQLSLPGRFYFDKAGNLYVPDNSWNIANRIQKFSLRNTFSYTPTTTGSYTAIVTLFNGCTFASNSVVVSNASILPDTTKACRDSVAVLNVGTGYSSYQWSNGANTNSISVLQNGLYNVTVTSPNGCVIRDSSYVSIINARIITNDTSICRGETIQLSVTLNNERNPVFDSDGNRYETIQIGKQIWMKSNLRTSRYNNGTSISKIIPNLNWTNSIIGAYSWMNNDSAAYEKKYGKLYNWYAINDSRGIAPQGFRIPTGSDWNKLIKFLDPQTDTSNSINVSGNFLKEKGLLNWASPNLGANNITGFTGLPGGFRDLNGNYSELGLSGYWLAFDAIGTNFIGRKLGFNQNSFARRQFTKKSGLSVRCLKDTATSVPIFKCLWSTGDTTLSISVNPIQSTTYYCTISNGITSCIDSVTITVGINPFSDTTKICGDSTILDAGAGYSNYSWNTGDTTRSIIVRSNGFYKVNVTNINGCISSDSTYVSLLNTRIFQNDTIVCRGANLSLTLELDTSNIIIDNDSNNYPIVKIGNQVWLQKNLNSNTYRNGDTIPQVTDSLQWTNLTSGAWCWFNNDSLNYGSIYGKLYNWYAINDSRGLAPEAWKIPTEFDWNQLVSTLGGPSLAGEKLKETGTAHWNSPNIASNTSNFTALPAGNRGTDGIFRSIRNIGLWWSSTPFNNLESKSFFLLNFEPTSYLATSPKNNAFSVRCLKNIPNINLISLWSTGDTSQQINVTPQQTTTYYATVSNGINTCVDSVKITIPIIDTSITVLDTSATICSNNGSVRLQAGLATSYQWLFNGVPIPNANSRIDTARQTGLYTVVLTNSIGCSDTSQSIQVNIFSLPQSPIITANGPTSFCSTSSVILSTTSNNVTYQWYNNNNPISLGTNSTLSINQSGGYTLGITNSNGCTSFSNLISITVNPLPSASITYTGTSFCTSLNTAQPVIRIGTAGGVYGSSPVGLSLNTNSGAVLPSASSPGVYNINYTIPASNSCPSVTSSTTITITLRPTATISYSGSSFCRAISTPQTVIKTGTTGGTYSSIPAGLSINASNGAITPSVSNIGNYTVSYTIPAANGCASFVTQTNVSIVAAPSATITYLGSPFCKSNSTLQAVTRTGTTGGTYSSTPAGLIINSTTGSILPSSSTAGTYTVIYTIPSTSNCPAVSVNTTVTITAVPSASITYAGSPFCKSLTTAQPITRTGTAGGTFSSSPVGLSLNTNTGSITPSTSTAGSYTITYTVPASDGCSPIATQTSVTVSNQPSANIAYTGSPYCRSLTTSQSVTRTGTSGGTYTSSPVGLSLNSTTGAIVPSASTAGTYTVTYTIPSSSGCPIYTRQASVTITQQPTASITYSGSPYCRALTTAQSVTRTGNAGGTFTSSPVGLSINISIGAIIPSTSNVGTYTVTYTVPSSNGCGPFNTQTNVVITAQPSASISYPGSPYCKTISTGQPVNRVGTSGGTYSASPVGLSINTATGTIIPSASNPGVYTVTYTIAAVSGCSVYNRQTTVTITAQPSATISYPGSPFCRTLTSPQPVIRTGTTGGIFSSTPTGLALSSTTGAITPSTSTAGTYVVNYTIPASGGCLSSTFSSSPVVIGSSLPIGNISPAIGNICEGSTVQISANGGSSYQWYKNGSIISGATNAVYSASTAGTYTVQLISNNGCSAFANNSSVLTFTKTPVANFTYGSYCINKPISFVSTSNITNSRPVTYRWSFGPGLGVSTLENPPFTFVNPGNYSVSLTVRSTLCPNLSSVVTTNLNIDPFVPNVRYPTVNAIIPPGEQLNARTFSFSPTYVWSPSTGLNSSNIYNPFFNTISPQQYIITITSPAGCIIKDTVKVNVFTSQDIFVPKGFSPNNDGANDKLFPYLVGIRSLTYFQVYNRWGQKVYETRTEGAGWDGKYRGVDQPIETYTWIAEGIGLDGKVVKRSGGALLMR